MHLPLDPRFSGLVSRIAPNLSLRQVEYLLQARSARDWHPQDLRRIRYVYSIKRKVLQIAESYGGLSFLPQSFLLSVFLGEATRSSYRVSPTRPRRRYEVFSRGRGGSTRRRPRRDRTSDSLSYTSSSKKHSDVRRCRSTTTLRSCLSKTLLKKAAARTRRDCSATATVIS